MDMSEINLNKVSNDEILEIYSKTEEFIKYLDDEIKSNEVKE